MVVGWRARGFRKPGGPLEGLESRVLLLLLLFLLLVAAMVVVLTLVGLTVADACCFLG